MSEIYYIRAYKFKYKFVYLNSQRKEMRSYAKELVLNDEQARKRDSTDKSYVATKSGQKSLPAGQIKSQNKAGRNLSTNGLRVGLSRTEMSGIRRTTEPILAAKKKATAKPVLINADIVGVNNLNSCTGGASQTAGKNERNTSFAQKRAFTPVGRRNPDLTGVRQFSRPRKVITPHNINDTSNYSQAECVGVGVGHEQWNQGIKTLMDRVINMRDKNSNSQTDYPINQQEQPYAGYPGNFKQIHHAKNQTTLNSGKSHYYKSGANLLAEQNVAEKTVIPDNAHLQAAKQLLKEPFQFERPNTGEPFNVLSDLNKIRNSPSPPHLMEAISSEPNLKVGQTSTQFEFLVNKNFVQADKHELDKKAARLNKLNALVKKNLQIVNDLKKEIRYEEEKGSDGGILGPKRQSQGGTSRFSQERRQKLNKSAALIQSSNKNEQKLSASPDQYQLQTPLQLVSTGINLLYATGRVDKEGGPKPQQSLAEQGQAISQNDFKRLGSGFFPEIGQSVGLRSKSPQSPSRSNTEAKKLLSLTTNSRSYQSRPVGTSGARQNRMKRVQSAANYHHKGARDCQPQAQSGEKENRNGQSQALGENLSGARRIQSASQNRQGLGSGKRNGGANVQAPGFLHTSGLFSHKLLQSSSTNNNINLYQNLQRNNQSEEQSQNFTTGNRQTAGGQFSNAHMKGLSKYIEAKIASSQHQNQQNKHINMQKLIEEGIQAFLIEQEKKSTSKTQSNTESAFNRHLIHVDHSLNDLLDVHETFDVASKSDHNVFGKESDVRVEISTNNQNQNLDSNISNHQKRIEPSSPITFEKGSRASKQHSAQKQSLQSIPDEFIMAKSNASVRKADLLRHASEKMSGNLPKSKDETCLTPTKSVLKKQLVVSDDNVSDVVNKVRNQNENSQVAQKMRRPGTANSRKSVEFKNEPEFFGDSQNNFAISKPRDNLLSDGSSSKNYQMGFCEGSTLLRPIIKDSERGEMKDNHGFKISKNQLFENENIEIGPDPDNEEYDSYPSQMLDPERQKKHRQKQIQKVYQTQVGGTSEKMNQIEPILKNRSGSQNSTNRGKKGSTIPRSTRMFLNSSAKANFMLSELYRQDIEKFKGLLRNQKNDSMLNQLTKEHKLEGHLPEVAPVETKDRKSKIDSNLLKSKSSGAGGTTKIKRNKSAASVSRKVSAKHVMIANLNNPNVVPVAMAADANQRRNNENCSSIRSLDASSISSQITQSSKISSSRPNSDRSKSAVIISQEGNRNIKRNLSAMQKASSKGKKVKSLQRKTATGIQKMLTQKKSGGILKMITRKFTNAFSQDPQVNNQNQSPRTPLKTLFSHNLIKQVNAKSPRSPKSQARERIQSGSPSQKKEENQIDIRIGDRKFEQRKSVGRKSTKKSGSGGGFANKLINIMRLAAKKKEEMNRYNQEETDFLQMINEAEGLVPEQFRKPRDMTIKPSGIVSLFNPKTGQQTSQKHTNVPPLSLNSNHQISFSLMSSEDQFRRLTQEKMSRDIHNTNVAAKKSWLEEEVQIVKQRNTEDLRLQKNVQATHFGIINDDEYLNYDIRKDFVTKSDPLDDNLVSILPFFKKRHPFDIQNGFRVRDHFYDSKLFLKDGVKKTLRVADLRRSQSQPKLISTYQQLRQQDRKLAQLNALAQGIDFDETKSQNSYDSTMSSDRIRVRPLLKGTSVKVESLKAKKAFDDQDWRVKRRNFNNLIAVPIKERPKEILKEFVAKDRQWQNEMKTRWLTDKGAIANLGNADADFVDRERIRIQELAFQEEQEVGDSLITFIERMGMISRSEFDTTKQIRILEREFLRQDRLCPRVCGLIQHIDLKYVQFKPITETLLQDAQVRMIRDHFLKRPLQIQLGGDFEKIDVPVQLEWLLKMDELLYTAISHLFHTPFRPAPILKSLKNEFNILKLPNFRAKLEFLQDKSLNGDVFIPPSIRSKIPRSTLHYLNNELVCSKQIYLELAVLFADQVYKNTRDKYQQTLKFKPDWHIDTFEELQMYKQLKGVPDFNEYRRDCALQLYASHDLTPITCHFAQEQWKPLFRQHSILILNHVVQGAKQAETLEFIQEFVEEAHWSDESEVTLEADPPLHNVNELGFKQRLDWSPTKGSPVKRPPRKPKSMKSHEQIIFQQFEPVEVRLFPRLQGIDNQPLQVVREEDQIDSLFKKAVHLHEQFEHTWAFVIQVFQTPRPLVGIQNRNCGLDEKNETENKDFCFYEILIPRMKVKINRQFHAAIRKKLEDQIRNLKGQISKVKNEEEKREISGYKKEGSMFQNADPRSMPKVDYQSKQRQELINQMDKLQINLNNVDAEGPLSQRLAAEFSERSIRTKHRELSKKKVHSKKKPHINVENQNRGQSAGPSKFTNQKNKKHKKVHKSKKEKDSNEMTPSSVHKSDQFNSTFVSKFAQYAVNNRSNS